MKDRFAYHFENAKQILAETKEQVFRRRRQLIPLVFAGASAALTTGLVNATELSEPPAHVWQGITRILARSLTRAVRLNLKLKAF